jgi:hypothetical protein
MMCLHTASSLISTKPESLWESIPIAGNGHVFWNAQVKHNVCKDADLVLADKAFNVRLTIVKGEVIFSK